MIYIRVIKRWKSNLGLIYQGDWEINGEGKSSIYYQNLGYKKYNKISVFIIIRKRLLN